MTTDQKEVAKTALLETYERLHNHLSESPTQSTESSPQSSPAPVPKKSRFDEYLDSLESQGRVPRTGDFRDMTQKIEELGRVTAKSVWDIINMYPTRIQPACRALASIPTTQVSVERSFSQLRLLMRDNRASLKPDLTEALLFLRTKKLM